MKKCCCHFTLKISSTKQQWQYFEYKFERTGALFSLIKHEKNEKKLEYYFNRIPGNYL